MSTTTNSCSSSAAPRARATRGRRRARNTTAVRGPRPTSAPRMLDLCTELCGNQISRRLAVDAHCPCTYLAHWLINAQESPLRGGLQPPLALGARRAARARPARRVAGGAAAAAGRGGAVRRHAPRARRAHRARRACSRIRGHRPAGSCVEINQRVRLSCHRAAAVTGDDVASMAWNRHAIEQTESRGRRVRRLKTDFHTGGESFPAT